MARKSTLVGLWLFKFFLGFVMLVSAEWRIRRPPLAALASFTLIGLDMDSGAGRCLRSPRARPCGLNISACPTLLHSNPTPSPLSPPSHSPAASSNNLRTLYSLVFKIPINHPQSGNPTAISLTYGLSTDGLSCAMYPDPTPPPAVGIDVDPLSALIFVRFDASHSYRSCYHYRLALRFTLALGGLVLLFFARLKRSRAVFVEYGTRSRSLADQAYNCLGTAGSSTPPKDIFESLRVQGRSE
ncbi:hypothetical protein B0H11DRAFT_1908443 [Mycena galericulata]|nr:hypothetical protein B0H11DRAFT_1908443 [Mycena galericulata]